MSYKKKGRRRDAIGSSAGTNPNGPIALEPVPLYRHRSWLCPLLLHLSSLSSFYFVILTQRINTTHLSIAHPPYLDTSSLFNAKKSMLIVWAARPCTSLPPHPIIPGIIYTYTHTHLFVRCNTTHHRCFSGKAVAGLTNINAIIINRPLFRPEKGDDDDTLENV